MPNNSTTMAHCALLRHQNLKNTNGSYSIMDCMIIEGDSHSQAHTFKIQTDQRQLGAAEVTSPRAHQDTHDLTST